MKEIFVVAYRDPSIRIHESMEALMAGIWSEENRSRIRIWSQLQYPQDSIVLRDREGVISARVERYVFNG